MNMHLPIITATNLLRAVLADVRNDAEKAREALLISTHTEARSAARILRRAMMNAAGATHVEYAGRGGFEAVEPELEVFAVDADLKATLVGTWDSARWGRLVHRRFRSSALEKAKTDLAPDATFIRVVNKQTGVTAATSAWIRQADPAGFKRTLDACVAVHG